MMNFIYSIVLFHSIFLALHTTSKACCSLGIEIRQPVTEVDNCNIADVLFISQIYNVKLELKHNSEQKVEAYSVKPKLQQT